MKINKYNIRVYGILQNNQNEILVSTESKYGKTFTKFPGGGHHFGEGLTDCLKREFIEELDLTIQIESHFYTTDFFQNSVFDDDSQLISIYYRVSCEEYEKIENGVEANDVGVGDKNNFYWLPISSIAAETFTFPIDQHVAKLLAKKSL